MRRIWNDELHRHEWVLEHIGDKFAYVLGVVYTALFILAFVAGFTIGLVGY